MDRNGELPAFHEDAGNLPQLLKELLLGTVEHREQIGCLFLLQRRVPGSHDLEAMAACVEDLLQAH